MIFSKEQMFSDGQGPITTATTTTSTNVIDLGVPGTVRNAPLPLIRDIGPGEPIAVWISSSPSNAAAITLQVQLVQATDAALTQNVDILATSKVTTLNQSKGTPFSFNWLPDGVNKRFIGLKYITVGTGFSINVDAGITFGKQSNLTVAAA